MFGVRLAQKEELVLAIKECNRVTSLHVINYFDVCLVSPRVRHFLVHRIHLSDFYVKQRRFFHSEGDVRTALFSFVSYNVGGKIMMNDRQTFFLLRGA
jgi:hypothetical protein